MTTSSAINPRIVYGSISGFGQDGPVRPARRRRPDRAGHGRADVDHRLARPGAGARRHPDRRPHRRQPARARHHDGAVRPRAHRRRALGHDQPAGSAGVHARLPGVALADGEARWRGRPATITRPASRPACSRPATGTSTSPPAPARLWERFCEAIGRPEWSSKPEWQTQKGRSADRKAINAAIGEITQHKPAAHWIELFEGAGIPCGPIYTIDQVFADPQVKHLGMARRCSIRGSATTRWFPPRSTSPASRKDIRTPTPEAGADTDDVLRSVGYSDAEIAEMRAKGAI